MRINSIVNRYIFREIFPPFIISLGFLSFVFLLAEILEITNMVVNYNASLVSVFLLILYYTPEFLQYTIPMSVMMAILLTFLRMAADNEIIAIKAGGGSIWHLIPPVFFFSFLGFAATFWVTVYGLAWGHSSQEQLVMEIASKSADASLREGTFNDNVDGFMVYVNKIDIKNKTLHDIFIHDSRDEKKQSTIIAPKGKRYTDQKHNSLTLRLFDGVINRVNLEDRSVNSIRFDTYDLDISLNKESGGKPKKKKKRKSKTIKELKAFAEKTDDEIAARTALMEIHKRFALPAACFALGLLAMPLGLKSAFARKSSGLGLGLVCFLAYYLLLGTGLSCGKSGLLSPLPAVWLPDFIMGTIGIVFLVRVAGEKDIGLGFGLVAGAVRNLYRRIKHWSG